MHNMFRLQRILLLFISTVALLIGLATADPNNVAPKANETAPSNVFGIGEPKKGWTSSPDGRGTLDIIWSSITTSFLCCWSVLCLNVSGRNDSSWVVYRRKIFLALFTLFAPEVVCYTAMGQYYWAHRSVKEFARAAKDTTSDTMAADLASWKLKDAFIANMGGFLLEINDSTRPINAKQLLWMIQNGHLDLPRPQLKALADKNKVDGVLRLVMILQALWYALSALGRLVQKLAVTTMESTTVGFIYCAIMFMVLWREKPADIATAEILRIKDAANEQKVSDYLTQTSTPGLGPDDGRISKGAMRKYFVYFRSLLLLINLPVEPDEERVLNMTSDDIPPWFFGLGMIACMGYCAPFVAHWKSVFPTKTEQLLWRIASLGSLLTLSASLIITYLMFFTSWTKKKILRRRETDKDIEAGDNPPISREFVREGEESERTQVQEEGAEHSTQNPSTPPGSEGKDHAVTKKTNNVKADCEVGENIPVSGGEVGVRRTPTWETELPVNVIVLIWILGTIHVVCRTYILLEDVLELRSLPQSAYKSVEWSDIFPHVS